MIIVEDPNFFAALSINLGSLITLVFSDTLSAPLSNNFEISSKLLIPPPTVRGIEIALAVFQLIPIDCFSDTSLQQHLDKIALVSSIFIIIICKSL